jgi:hypothetical protein
MLNSSLYLSRHLLSPSAEIKNNKSQEDNNMKTGLAVPRWGSDPGSFGIGTSLE